MRLENFRQHKLTEVEFRDGMTAIVGANGTGKSTLLEAITYALYGQQRKTKETIKFYWAEPRSKFRVTLDFEFDGKQYCVDRSSTDASLVEIIEDFPHPRASGLREVSAACERLLALSYEQFKNSFCAEQKSLAFLDFKNNSVRQDEVARMLGFDRLKLASAIGKDRARDLKNRCQWLEQSLGDPEQIRRRKKEADEELKEVRKGIADLEKLLSDVELKLAPAQEKAELAERFLALTGEMKEIGGRADGLKTGVKQAEDALSKAKEEAEELKRLTPLENEYRQLERELKQLEEAREKERARESALKEIQQRKSDLEAAELKLAQVKVPDLKKLQSRLDEAQQKAVELEKASQDANAEWHARQMKANADLAGAKARAEQALQDLDKARATVERGECPECGQPLSEGFKKGFEEKQALVETRMGELRQAQAEAASVTERPKNLADLDSSFEQAKALVESIRAELSSANLIQQQADLLRSQVDGLKKQVADLTANLPQETGFSKQAWEKTQARKTALEPEHLRCLRLADAPAKVEAAQRSHLEAKKQLDEAKARYGELQAERGKTGVADAAQAAELVGAFRALQIEHSNTQTSIQKSQKNLDYAQRIHDQAVKELGEHQARKAEYDLTKSDLAHIDFTEKELRNLREYLNQTIRPDLQLRASENLNLLTNGRYLALELDENFDAVVQEDGIEKTVISGGEEDVVALALRLALSELIQERQGRPMSLLVLDEVFGALDAERRQSVLDRLSAIKGRFTQILVISHIEEINQVADHCHYLFRDPEQRATIVTDAPPLDLDLIGL